MRNAVVALLALFSCVPMFGQQINPPAVIGFSAALSGNPSKTLTVGAECAPTTPCNVRVDSTVFSIMNKATAVIGSGVSASGTMIMYISNIGTFQEVDNLGTGNVTCTNCNSTQSATPTFPTAVFPILSVQVTNGVYAALSDERSGATIASYIGGACIDSAVSSGITTFSVDPACQGSGSTTGTLFASFLAVGVSASSTQYFAFSGNSSSSSFAVNRAAPIVSGCTALNAYVVTFGNQPSTGSLVFNLYDATSSSTTGLGVTVAAGAAGGSYNSGGTTETLTAGDIYTWQVINNATTSSANIRGMGFQCR